MPPPSLNSASRTRVAMKKKRSPRKAEEGVAKPKVSIQPKFEPSVDIMDISSMVLRKENEDVPMDAPSLNEEPATLPEIPQAEPPRGFFDVVSSMVGVGVGVGLPLRASQDSSYAFISQNDAGDEDYEPHTHVAPPPSRTVLTQISDRIGEANKETAILVFGLYMCILLSTTVGYHGYFAPSWLMGLTIHQSNYWSRAETDNGPLKIVFLMGIDGLGHDAWSLLTKYSPKRIQEPTEELLNLNSWFYEFNEAEGWADGMWSVSCSQTHDRDSNVYMDELTEFLIQAKETYSDGGTKVFPLNGWQGDADAESKMTYPDGNAEQDENCRLLQFPNIDSLYAACDAAGVDCAHVVLLYRNFDEHMGVRDIVTLTGMINTIHGQIIDHPERLAACWDFDGGLFGALSLAPVLGYSTRSFASHYKKIYHRLTAETTASVLFDEDEVVSDPAQLKVYRDSLEQAMHRLARSCLAEDDFNEWD
uniref:Uncharacterized protein n=1 Tax=Attheya septentrionalis TaxID=420275 RepID=A0A7S2UMZ8_9STRA|mmetsp:Transcript_5359/g.9443  ORF Transcript_5359/g.9443 Transcript_5359/m.9443 type:complete len:476 (+) Transcript_5359:123-1550(+)